MFRWTLLPCLLVCAAVHAAPTTVAEDAVERLLTDKGLIERLGGQLEHVRHTAGEKASELVVNAMGFLGVPYKRGGPSRKPILGITLKPRSATVTPAYTGAQLRPSAPGSPPPSPPCPPCPNPPPPCATSAST